MNQNHRILSTIFALVLFVATGIAQTKTEVPSTQLRIPITQPTILVAVPSTNGVIFRELVVSGGLQFSEIAGVYTLSYQPPVAQGVIAKSDTFTLPDNGVPNQTVQLTQVPVADKSISCFVNGLAVTPSIDYTRVGRDITFTGTRLLGGYLVRCDYSVAQ